MNSSLKWVWIFVCLVQLTSSQIDERRRRRNPYEFFQVGPETHVIHDPHDLHDHHHSNDHIHHSYRELRLHSIPPVGSSEFVKYFARRTSGELAKEHHIHHAAAPISSISYVAEPAVDVCCDTVVETRVVRPVPDNHHNHDDDHPDPHSSHRNFLWAGNNKYYTVRTPASHEPQAPIVAFYHSSYANRNRGGKLYLGNRPFYF